MHTIATKSYTKLFQLNDTSYKIAKRIQSDPLLGPHIQSGTTKLSSLPKAEGLPKDFLDLFQDADAVPSNNNKKSLTDPIKEAFQKPIQLEEFNKRIDEKTALNHQV
jgi:hypothetical protein